MSGNSSPHSIYRHGWCRPCPLDSSSARHWCIRHSFPCRSLAKGNEPWSSLPYELSLVSQSSETHTPARGAINVPTQILSCLSACVTSRLVYSMSLSTPCPVLCHLQYFDCFFIMNPCYVVMSLSRGTRVIYTQGREKMYIMNKSFESKNGYSFQLPIPRNVPCPKLYSKWQKTS